MTRPNRYLAASGLALLFAILPVSGWAATPLRVTIQEPLGGIIHDPIVTLEAEVSDPEVLSALVVSNGATYHVPVERGRIVQQLVVVPGSNRVGVSVRRGVEVARASLTFRYEGEPSDLMILLSWPSRGEIVDLWVREPGGETCKWDHRETDKGGYLLDFSQDAIGFGSQAYLLRRVRPGRFRVKVHYWGMWGEDDQRGRWAYDDLIARLDQLDERLADPSIKRKDAAKLREERKSVLRRLDRWASAAAPQTPVRAEAVLFPGTPFERRWSFDVVAERTGQLRTLGEIEIDPAMIRRARRSQP